MLRERLWRAAQLLAAGAALPPLVALALVEGVRTRLHRRERPRVLWGPTPIIALKYWSESIARRGYESLTFAHGVYDINRREDFDVHRDDFLRGVPRADAVRDFFVFAWALRVADVHVTYFNGGYLRHTLLRRLEGALLRVAGKKLIVTPYGSDIAVPGHLGAAEEPLLRDYPAIARTGDAVRRRVLWFCRWADLVIRNYQYGFLPRGDVLWPTIVALDTERWRVAGSGSGADGRDGEVVVVHAPNHRHVKGTRHLLEAVDQLRAEGLRVRLDLIERRPNEEVRAAVAAADVVAEQFIAGYALFAIEGMSAGKPVMSAMRALAEDVRRTPAIRECPIVDAGADDLTNRLHELVVDPDLRTRLGHAGRDFAERHHSYAAVGRIWVALIEHVWNGAPLPEEVLPPARPD